MKRTLPIVFLVLLLTQPGRAADPFTLKEGDRVVFLGNTLIEREQRYGYWEQLLSARAPQQAISFRNLGWSGDTVWGEARARFGSPADGFRHLKEHVLALKPTVILLGYGTNEAFEGKEGLPRFEAQLKVLLTTLAPTQARLVLLSPLKHENLGAPLPDPTPQNENLRLYSDALRKMAAREKLVFIDLYTLVKADPKGPPLTDDGMHLTDFGYWRTTAALEQGFALPSQRWELDLQVGRLTSATGAKVAPQSTNPLRFEVTDFALPFPLNPTKGNAPRALPGHERILRVQGLADGKYTLKIDGTVVATAPAAAWGKGVALTRGPEFAQAEQLRQAIRAKNLLYFHRWRPQNETYLFGFRKHEQGQNAREIPQFDPLIEKAEKEIARLSVPVSQRYELVPAQEGQK